MLSLKANSVFVPLQQQGSESISVAHITMEDHVDISDLSCYLRTTGVFEGANPADSKAPGSP